MNNIAKKIAIIGLGKQSKNELIPAILKLKTKCEVVAICDINKSTVKKR